MFFWRGSSNQLQSTPSCGKTCLLFQFVFNVALHSNNNVIFICYRLRLDSKPPFLSQGIDPSSHVFHRIQMKYVNDDQDIRKYFAAFHLCDALPAAVLIDDFGDFFDDKRMNEGDVPGSFIVKDRSHSPTDHTTTIKAAKYSIALQYLVFHGIVEDQLQ